MTEEFLKRINTLAEEVYQQKKAELLNERKQNEHYADLLKEFVIAALKTCDFDEQVIRFYPENIDQDIVNDTIGKPYNLYISIDNHGENPVVKINIHYRLDKNAYRGYVDAPDYILNENRTWNIDIINEILKEEGISITYIPTGEFEILFDAAILIEKRDEIYKRLGNYKSL